MFPPSLHPTNIPIPMNMIKSPQQPKQMRNTSTNNQAMHNLVTRTPDIKPVRIPFLRNLRVVVSPPSLFFRMPAKVLLRLNQLTLIAYNAPPVRLNVVINAIQSKLILHICVSQPNFSKPCTMGMMKERPRPAYMAAR